MQRIFLLTLLLVLPLSLFARSEWSASQPIPTKPSPFDASTSLVSCYLEESAELFVIWQQNPSSYFCYSLYSQGGWTPIATVPPSVGHRGSPSSAYLPSTNEVVISWKEGSTGLPTYMTYVNGTFSTPTPLPAGQPAGSDIVLTYYPDQEQIFATWSDASSLKIYFATYDGEWSTPTLMSPSRIASSNICTTYDAARGAIVATWSGGGPGIISYLPYYATYTGGVWSEPVELSVYQFSAGGVSCCYNAADQTTLCAWVDFATTLPLYSVINDNGPTAAKPIPHATTISPQNPITLACTQGSQEILGFWSEQHTETTLYTAYQGGHWSTPNTFSGSSTTTVPIAASYYPPTKQLVATWAKSPPGDPYFSLYTNLAPNPPQNFSGMQKINNFGVTSERFNVLQWEKSSSPNTAGYIVYRNGTQIATIGSEITSYEDHNRTTAKDTYILTAVSAHDGISTPVTITVGGP